MIGAPRPVRLVPGPEIEAWGDPEIEAYTRTALRTGVPAPTSLALEANAPRVLRAFARHWWAVVRAGTLDPALKERMRVRMAEAAGCRYCATSAAEDADGGLPPPGRDELPPLDLDGLTSADALALRLADVVAAEPWRLDASLRTAVLDAFPPDELAELLAFVAWQSGGPRAIRAWGAETYKPGARVDPDTLPVPLPYVARTGPVPPAPPPVAADPATVLAVAETSGWPPAGWVRVLAPRPDLLGPWLELADATTSGPPLGDRIGALTREAVGTALLFPAWAPPVADPATDAERLAVAYVRALAVRGEVPDDLRAAALEGLGDGGVVQLGFAVACQAGACLLVRWLDGGDDPASAAIRLVD